jgi:hypothetical protein
MLKKAAGFVLGSKQSSTYPRGYASGCFDACGLVEMGFLSVLPFIVKT